MHGNTRLGGNSLLECVVFGSVVGTSLPIPSQSPPSRPLLSAAASASTAASSASSASASASSSSSGGGDAGQKKRRRREAGLGELAAFLEHVHDGLGLLVERRDLALLAERPLALHGVGSG